MNKRETRMISSKYFRALQNFESSLIRDEEKMINNSYIILDELNDILNALPEEELKEVLLEVKQEIIKKPGALNTLEQMKKEFPSYVPLVIGLGEKFTTKIVNIIDKPDDIHTNVNEELIFTNLKNDFNKFLNQLKQDVRLEFIGFLTAFINSGDYEYYQNDLKSLNNQDKLKFIIQVINKNNAFGNEVIRFNNNQLEMKTMGSGLTDIIYLSEQKEIITIDVTSSFGSEIEGNQFLRHKLAVERYNLLFAKSDKSIVSLRRIVQQVNYQISNQVYDNPYEEFKYEECKEQFISKMSENYSVIQASHFTKKNGEHRNTSIKYMNVLTFLAYFSNIKKNGVELVNDNEIELFMSKINFQFIGTTLPDEKVFNAKFSNVENIKKTREHINKLILDLLTGKKTDNNISQVLNINDVFLSLLKYIDYMQSSDAIDNKKFKLLTVDEINKLEEYSAYKNNPANTQMFSLLNSIKERSRTNNPNQKETKKKRRPVQTDSDQLFRK